jgi:hypothetical protein
VNAIVDPTGNTEVVAVREGGTLAAVIERALSDPNTSIDTLERLLAMQERVYAAQAKAEYITALAEMQPKLPIIGRKGEIIIKEKNTERIIQTTAFARFEDIIEAIRPVLGEHGFSLSFRVEKDADRVNVTAILSHRAGHSDETTLSLPMDTSGSKNNVQAIGSSLSYGRRYATCALLNIVTRGEDDDGKLSGDPGRELITHEQADELRDLMESVGADAPKFLRYLKVDTLAELPASRFGEAVAQLERKRGA